MSDLEFVPTEKLMQEFLQRMSAGIIIGIRNDEEGTLQHGVYRMWIGDPITILGLCQMVSHNLLGFIDQCGRPPKE